jgi:hypothetical protein
MSGAAIKAKEKRQAQSKARKALKEAQKKNAPKKSAKGTVKPRTTKRNKR